MLSSGLRFGFDALAQTLTVDPDIQVRTTMEICKECKILMTVRMVVRNTTKHSSIKIAYTATDIQYGC